MKRMIFALVFAVLCVSAIAPVTAYAKTYDLSDTDVTISIDDTEWYVFTRDNIVNNPELDDLGVTAEQMRDVFYDNDAYMDAILFYDSGGFIELFIIKKETDVGVVNLSNYSDEEVLEMAKGISDGKKGVDDYSVYQGEYKFVRVEYADTAPDNIKYNICEYLTVVNRDIYSFKTQSISQFDEDDYKRIEEIIKSVKFDVDESLKEDTMRNLGRSFLTEVIVHAAVGAACGGIALLAVRIKKRADKKACAESAAKLNGEAYVAPGGYVRPEGYAESAGYVKPDDYGESDGIVKPDEYSKE